MEGLHSKIEDTMFLVRRKAQVLVDRLAVYRTGRWIGLALLAVLYCLRVVFTEGYAVITYLLGLYYLN